MSPVAPLDISAGGPVQPEFIGVGDVVRVAAGESLELSVIDRIRKAW